VALEPKKTKVKNVVLFLHSLYVLYPSFQQLNTTGAAKAGKNHLNE
jgi:hypothetical protein